MWSSRCNCGCSWRIKFSPTTWTRPSAKMRIEVQAVINHRVSWLTPDCLVVHADDGWVFTPIIDHLQELHAVSLQSFQQAGDITITVRVFYYSSTFLSLLAGIEYWQRESPPSEETTVMCDASGEDESCSASIPSRGVTAAHTTVWLPSDILCPCTWQDI